MKIQVNTDRNIASRLEPSAYITGVVESALSRFNERISRVEVHVSDENADKISKNDMRCVMEVRLNGRQPVAVTEQAATLEQAVTGAAGRLARMLESTLGRERDQARQAAEPPTPKPPVVESE